jgi:hypothetical protein
MDKPHEYYLDIDFWEDHCLLVWPVTQETAEQWYKEKFPNVKEEDFPEINAAGMLSYCGDQRIIFMKEWEMSVEKIAWLAHECVHIANLILTDKGVDEKDGKDEALAYFVSYLMRKLLEAIKQIEGEIPADEQRVGE